MTSRTLSSTDRDHISDNHIDEKIAGRDHEIRRPADKTGGAFGPGSNTGGAFGPDSKNGGVFELGSKSAGFFVRQRELAGRRLWPIALTFLSCLLYNTAVLATVLNSAAEDAALGHVTSLKKAGLMRDALRGMLGAQSPAWVLIVLPLAALLAIEGFAWMDSRREVDFYESLPVLRGRRFLDLCVSGFLYFFFSWTITLEAGLLIADAFGALSRPLVAEILLHSVKLMAFFLAVYALGILSTMLTGNVIVACLAFCVLLFYEILFRSLLNGFASEFFATWGGSFTSPLADSIFSPVSQYLHRSPSWTGGSLRLLALAAFYFILARICYSLRKNERAGSAVVFGPVSTVVRIAMSLFMGLFAGLLFISVSRTPGGTIISIVWMLLFVLITACLMQIIYEYDFRALFHRPAEIAAAAALALVIYAAFFFDVTGYDRFAPDPDQVEKTALISTQGFGSITDDEGSMTTMEDFGEKYMRLDNVEDVMAIARYGQAYSRLIRGLPDDASGSTNTNEDIDGSDSSVTREDNNGSAPSVTSDKTDSSDSTITIEKIDGSGETETFSRPREEFEFRVVYYMKNGRTHARRIILPSTIDPAVMDAVTGTDQYRQGSFFVYHDELLRRSASRLMADCSNGKDWKSAAMDKSMYEAFRQAYITDLSSFSYSFARKNKPVARLTLSSQDKSGEDIYADSPAFYIDFPVYASFENTIAVLRKYQLWTEPLDVAAFLDEDFDYNRLSASEKILYDSLDMSVFAGPF